MDTRRVDICYRPLRIAWAIHSGDRNAFRDAVRLSHTLWGGRFNPIVMVDRAEEAKQLIELYRADMIVPVGGAEETREFPKRFPHLQNPFYPEALSPEALFLRAQGAATRAQVLDIYNALAHWHDTPGWKEINEQGVRLFVWDDDDPLADVFLLQYGQYPNVADLGIDYAEILSRATQVSQCRFEKARPIPIDVLEHPNLGYLTRLGLHRHYSELSGWDHAGFFVGNADNIDDLASFWNLRAADVQLQFLDPAHLDRYTLIRSEYQQQTLAYLAGLPEDHGRIAIWSRPEIIEASLKLFDGQPLIACRVSGPFLSSVGGSARQ
jgi:hypothetical protein